MESRFDLIFTWLQAQDAFKLSTLLRNPINLAPHGCLCFLDMSCVQWPQTKKRSFQQVAHPQCQLTPNNTANTLLVCATLQWHFNMNHNWHNKKNMLWCLSPIERIWKHRWWTLAWAGQYLQPGETGRLQADDRAGGLDGEESVRRVQQLPPGVRERGLSAEARHLPGQRRGLLQQSQRQTVHHAWSRQGRIYW